MIKYFPLLLLPLLNYAGDFYNSISFQGYTGLINIPNAEILEDGKVEFSFSNQVDAERVRFTRKDYTADQYMFNFGILPNLELTGRLTNIEKKDADPSKKYGNFLDRDLSYAFKYQLPFYHEYLPHVAIGMQDPVGNGRYSSKYIVASQQYAFLRATVGYSFDSDRLDGAFGGAEIKATDWVYLITEYDSKETQIGLRLNTPDFLSNYFDASILAKTNIDDKNQIFSIAFNIKLALGDDHHSVKMIDKNSDNNLIDIDTNTIKSSNKIELFKEKLVNFGFENIDIGNNSSTIYIAYENNILDHNELDAIGVILGYLVALDMPYQTFELVTKKSNLKVRKLTGSLPAYKEFIKDISVETVNNFGNSLVLNTDFDTNSIPLSIEQENSSYLKTRIELSPGIHDFVATEVGLFDYLVSLRPYLHWNLYKGIDLGILADLPLFHSENYDKDGPFRKYNKGNQLESLMIHKSDVFGDFINIASVGTYKDYLGGFDSLVYCSDNHTFSFKLGYLQDDEDENKDTKKIYLGTYSYYDNTFDTSVELTAGQFYNQDSGFEFKLKRFFGDTALTLFYQNSNTQFVGMGIEVPLTPRRVANSRYGQIKGKRDFYYQLRSSIHDKSGINVVNPLDVKAPTREFDIENRFLNRNRFSEAYIKKHLLRLRDTYFEYVEKF